MLYAFRGIFPIEVPFEAAFHPARVSSETTARECSILTFLDTQ